MAWAALTGPIAIAAGEAGGEVIGDGQQLGAVVLELAPGLGQRERQAGDLSLADGVLTTGPAGQFTPGQSGQDLAGQGTAGGTAISIVAGQQQGTQPAGLRGGGDPDFLPRDQQDAQCLAVTVSSRHRQPACIQAQRGQYCQMRVDGVGLAFPAALGTAGLLTLDHRQASAGQRPRQPDPVAAAALDAGHHPRPGGYLRDSSQQLREPGAVIADPHRGNWLASCVGDLYLMAVAVGVDPDDGIYYLCQHGHAASRLLPGSGAEVGTGLGGVTGWHICDGSRPRADRLLIRSTRWARPEPANPGTGQMKGTHERPDP